MHRTGSPTLGMFNRVTIVPLLHLTSERITSL